MIATAEEVNAMPIAASTAQTDAPLVQKVTGPVGQVAMSILGVAACRIIGAAAATVVDGGVGIMAIRPGVAEGMGLAGGTVAAGAGAGMNTNITIGTIDAR